MSYEFFFIEFKIYLVYFILLAIYVSVEDKASLKA
jgi:hypothetical protein